MRWNYLLSGFFMLLVASYIDNSRGLLLPVINETFTHDYAKASWFLVGGCFGAVATTLLLIPLTQRFHEKQVGIGVCLCAIISLLLGHYVSGYLSLIAFAVLIGTIVSTFGAMSNLFVISGTETHTRSRAMCGLHTMYGYGSLLAPAIAGRLLGHGSTWYFPLAVSLPAFVLLTLFILFSLPNRAKHEAVIAQSAKLTGLQVIILFSFAIYVAGEVLISMWMESYLVETAKLPFLTSAWYVTGFFLMMGTTRLLCFFSLTPALEVVILLASLVGAGFFFFLGHQGWYLGFSLAGIVGPYFPLFLARVSRTFPKQAATLTIWILTIMQLSLAFFHLFVGKIADSFGMARAYWTPELLLSLAFAGCLVYLLAESRELKRAPEPLLS